MKKIKTFIMAVALAMGFATANAADGVRVIDNYSVDFNTTIEGSRSSGWIVSKGWGRMASTSNSPYTYMSTGGVDGSGALKCNWVNSSAPDILVTPRVQGAVSIQVKLSSASGTFSFVKMTLQEDGTFVKGDVLASTASAELNTTDFVTVSLDEALTENTYVGILADYAIIDNFAAGRAEIDLFKGLKVVKCSSPASTVDCDADGNYKIVVSGEIQNVGDLDLNVGDENFTFSFGKYINSTTPHVKVATKAFEQNLAVGETATVTIEAVLNTADHSGRNRWDLIENVTKTSAAGTWVEAIPYVAILGVRDMNRNDLSSASYASKFGTFGMISTDVVKQFAVSNSGAASMQVKVTAPEGFTVSKSEFTVAAHEADTISLTAISAVPGIFSGNLVVENLSAEASVSIPLSATVLDVTKFYEPFEDNKSVNTIPVGWYECGNTSNWTKTSYTNNANNFVKNSNSTNPTILATPKLKVAEGEKMTFDAARNSTSGTSFINVYYSADRKNWTMVLPKENVDLAGTNAGTSSTATQTWKTFVVEGVPAGEYYIGFEAGYASLDNVYGFEFVEVGHDVVEKASKIPASATVNNEYVATFKAGNLRNVAEAEHGYVASLYFDGVEVASSEAVEIPAAGTADYEFAFTPHVAGTFPAYVKLSFVTLGFGDTYEVVSDTVQVTVGEEMATVDVVIGKMNTASSSYFTSSPLFVNYKNSVSETLYTAEMLAEAGLKAGDKIGSLTYVGYNTAGDVTTNVKAFVMNCNDTEFGTVDFTADAEMTEVFASEWTFKKQGAYSAPENMLVITFNEPFVYEGGALRVKVQSEATSFKNVYFAIDNSFTNLCYGNRNDGVKVADMTPSTTAWKFPVTKFGVVLTPEVLTGKVVDEAGAPLEGVSVVLLQVMEEAPVQGPAKVAQARYEGVTNAEGVYEIPVIQTGKTYEVTFAKEGYNSQVMTVSTIGELNDVVLEKIVPTGVTDVVTTKAVNSNVYTIDGRIVRKNAESLEGLDKGIYIFQGKKHVVK